MDPYDTQISSEDTPVSGSLPISGSELNDLNPVQLPLNQEFTLTASPTVLNGKIEASFYKAAISFEGDTVEFVEFILRDPLGNKVKSQVSYAIFVLNSQIS